MAHVCQKLALGAGRLLSSLACCLRDLSLGFRKLSRPEQGFVRFGKDTLFHEQRLFCNLTSRAVALDAPTCSSGDQQAQEGSEDQNGFGLVYASLSVCVA